MSPRIEPAQPPFHEKVQALLEERTGGRPPLVLFTMLARDPRLFERFLSGSLMDRGNLSLRNRELVVARATALSKCEYEWGIHAAIFWEKAGFTEEQILSTAKGGPADACWSPEEHALLTAVDQLNATCDLDDAAWDALKAHFSEEAIIEVLMLAGKYRMIAYLTNALRMPMEKFARRFPA